ncbi:hypothetical protein ACH4A3_07500 [Streptomyces sp. NPDC018007]|uniref:hypothetical protein n=1 Tax=Streptomyces sp. NPDC018007 TaxID=3365029 RepID=UPI003794D021
MTTTAPLAPTPTTAPAPTAYPAAPAPAQPSPAATAPHSPAAPPVVVASRRSVLLLAACLGLLATAGLAYVLIDRPDWRGPLIAVATIVGGFSGPLAVAWAVYRAARSR